MILFKLFPWLYLDDYYSFSNRLWLRGNSVWTYSVVSFFRKMKGLANGVPNEQPSIGEDTLARADHPPLRNGKQGLSKGTSTNTEVGFRGLPFAALKILQICLRFSRVDNEDGIRPPLVDARIR